MSHTYLELSNCQALQMLHQDAMQRLKPEESDCINNNSFSYELSSMQNRKEICIAKSSKELFSNIGNDLSDSSFNVDKYEKATQTESEKSTLFFNNHSGIKYSYSYLNPYGPSPLDYISITSRRRKGNFN